MMSHNQTTVFITEAAPYQARTLAEVLHSAGYQTRVYSEADGLLALLSHPPDLVILQVAGLDSEGYQLCRQIRANLATAGLPIVFAGIFETDGDAAQVFAVGGNDFVAAPFSAAEVVARVGHQLDRSRPGEATVKVGPGAIALAALDPARPQLLQASLQRLHNSLDLDTILQTAVRDVQQQTQADRVVIYQFRSSGRGIVTHEAVADQRLSVLHRHVEDVCFDREYAVKYWSGRVGQINDVEALASPNPCYRDMLLSFGIKANLVVPIIHNLMGQNRHLWGLIVLHQCCQPRQWLASEIVMLQELSAHLAIAIQQSHLFDQIGCQARQETLLNDILDEIRASLDVQDILTCAVEHLRAGLNLRQCGITLISHHLPSLPTPFVVREHDPALGELLPALQITEALLRQLRLDSDGVVTSASPVQLRPHLLQPIVQDQTTYVATAIPTNHQVRGVLWACPAPDQLAMASSKMGSWEDSDLRLIAEVALQLDQALHQAYLYQQLQVANDELQRLAHLDGLMQIANRREFDRYLAQEWQRLQREQGSLALVLADVDHFKGFNDTYGHLAGDDCLRSIGHLLAQVTKRPADLPARFGGEEFALILPNTTLTGAIALASEAQTYLKQLAIPNAASPLYGQVTLSFGIAALIPTLALTPELLIQRADQALYAAKAHGRNRYCLWSEAIESSQGQSSGRPSCIPDSGSGHVDG